MPTLYRMYRPQTFQEIVGQDHVTKTLTQAIVTHRLSHAFLLQGPRGTGKTTTARILAKRINCKKPKEAEPCNACETCRATTENRNMDIIEIDAASNRGIDDIRSLREKVGLSPTMSTYKVYIIDEVHMLSRDAFSALLKTLEEPVKHAVFILATTELHKVPATIISRCQVFRFRRASTYEMKSRLEYILSKEKRSADDEVLSFIASRSDGCYRDAESLLGQILSSHEKNVSLTSLTKSLGLPPPDLIDAFLDAIVQQNTARALELAQQAYSDGFDPEQFIQESIRAARDGLVLLTQKDTNIPLFASHTNAAHYLTTTIRHLIQATQDLAYVPQPMIALQIAILASSKTEKVIHPTPPSESPYAGSSSFVPIKSASRQSIKPQQQPTHNQPKHPAVSVEKVVSSWSGVIEKVRQTNPVSATFLRACEPISVEGATVILRVRFPLHCNFFEREENKNLVENSLSTLIHQRIHIKCNLEESKEVLTQLQQAKERKEKELLKNVQEVFGAGS